MALAGGTAEVRRRRGYFGAHALTRGTGRGVSLCLRAGVGERAVERSFQLALATARQTARATSGWQMSLCAPDMPDDVAMTVSALRL